MCSAIYMMFQHQKIGFPNKYIEAEIKKKLEKPEENLQVMKWKMILDITLNISITIPNTEAPA